MSPDFQNRATQTSLLRPFKAKPNDLRRDFSPNRPQTGPLNVWRNLRNSGYFRFLSISDCGEALELLFSAELKTNYFSLNMVYKMYLTYNFE